MGIASARHLDYSQQLRHEFHWSQYVVREELIRYVAPWPLCPRVPGRRCGPTSPVR